MHSIGLCPLPLVATFRNKGGEPCRSGVTWLLWYKIHATLNILQLVLSANNTKSNIHIILVIAYIVPTLLQLSYVITKRPTVLPLVHLATIRNFAVFCLLLSWVEAIRLRIAVFDELIKVNHLPWIRGQTIKSLYSKSLDQYLVWATCKIYLHCLLVYIRGKFLSSIWHVYSIAQNVQASSARCCCS